MVAPISRRSLFAAGLAAACAPPLLTSAAETGPLIPAAALGEDVAVFRRAYGALHPGLHRYNTPAEVDARFEVLARAVSRPRTLGQAQLLFTRAVAAVRCGHSFLNGANAEGPGLALICAGRNRLPFRFRWIGDRMVVPEDCPGNPALVRGTQVSAIGGVPCGLLRRELMGLASADGHNDAKRTWLAELHGEDDWELVDTYLPLLHPQIVQGGTARLTIRRPGGGSHTVEVGLLSRAERTAGLKAGVQIGENGEPIWRNERLADGSAWLTMRNWAVYDSKWDWKSALSADMDRLAAERAPGLVVDLRGNGGGLDVGDVILDRLADRPLRDVGARRLVRYRKVPDDLNPYLKTWDRSFRDWGAAAVGPDAQGFYRLTKYDDDPAEAAPARGPRFNGKLIVLIDAANSSATFQFAKALKDSGLATLVGQTTGGNRRGINGGAFFFLRLPGSGLEIDLPLIASFPRTPQPDAGVEPDVPVRITAADIAAGRDPVRERALQLLRS